ncbi:ion channel [Chamaesiphon sp. GL140_3_metabinner_50]|uniref:ion channel n=1 Tax=Chamaesiphon sp. GL140_3_metabinner_50 TaxID=2970812 RepID=UPI0025FEF745|nr:ion channel [Chamaesiphon sp. GL140_3_metabinner_50]
MKNRFRRHARTIKIENKDGRFVIHGMGNWYHQWRDPYHLLLTIPWMGFAVIVSVAYLCINALFAFAYLAGGDCLEGARAGLFSDAFFFSVQTLASIGYGAIHPKTFYANSIVTLESITSLLLIAVLTGIAFARFSRPIAKLLFSKFTIITSHNSQPTLMFRVANERNNFILEAHAQIYLIIDEITHEGDSMRRIHELKLLRQRTPSLVLTWTVMHHIDADSPLYGLDAGDLKRLNANISVLIGGVDESVAYAITARYIYNTEDILFDRKFTNLIQKSANGDRYFDYSFFHDTESSVESGNQ